MSISSLNIIGWDLGENSIFMKLLTCWIRRILPVTGQDSSVCGVFRNAGWLLYYDVHVCSNVACVNRKRVPKLASKMKIIFQQTLSEKDKVWTSFMKSEPGHEIVTTDIIKMASKYLQEDADTKK